MIWNGKGIDLELELIDDIGRNEPSPTPFPSLTYLDFPSPSPSLPYHHLPATCAAPLLRVLLYNTTVLVYLYCWLPTALPVYLRVARTLARLLCHNALPRVCLPYAHVAKIFIARAVCAFALLRARPPPACRTRTLPTFAARAAQFGVARAHSTLPLSYRLVYLFGLCWFLPRRVCRRCAAHLRYASYPTPHHYVRAFYRTFFPFVITTPCPTSRRYDAAPATAGFARTLRLF